MPEWLARQRGKRRKDVPSRGKGLCEGTPPSTLSQQQALWLERNRGAGRGAGSSLAGWAGALHTGAQAVLVRSWHRATVGVGPTGKGHTAPSTARCSETRLYCRCYRVLRRLLQTNCSVTELRFCRCLNWWRQKYRKTGGRCTVSTQAVLGARPADESGRSRPHCVTWEGLPNLCASVPHL